MESAKQPNGMIIRSEDGTIHFIRDEVLELTKVTEPEMAEFCARLLDQEATRSGTAQSVGADRGGADSGGADSGEEDDVATFAVARGPAVETLAFSGPFRAADSALADVNRAASSTVMCPGTMGLAEFEVLPAFRVQR